MPPASFAEDTAGHEEETEGFDASEAPDCDLVARRLYTDNGFYPDTGSSRTELWITPVGTVAVCVEIILDTGR